MDDLDQFRQLFRSAFRNPRQVAPKLRSKRFESIWAELEPIGDWLAGPFYSIMEQGECNYVFDDKENRFPGVVTPDDFQQWCLDLAQKYRDGIIANAPANEIERTDQELLLQMADEMVAMSHFALRFISRDS